jgi:hypothetical protein
MNDQTEQIISNSLKSSFQLINCLPRARSGTRAISYRGSIYYFGGYTRKGGTYFNDLFQYKAQEKQWYEIRQTCNHQEVNFPSISQSDHQVPEARTDHTFARYKNKFYVYGGRDEV